MMARVLSHNTAMTKSFLNQQFYHRTRLIIVLTLMALITYTVITTAWVCDDAYITFRTIDNFMHGYGLTWNVSERVQVYTHPLWMFLLAGFYALTHEIYLTTLAISFVLTLLTVGLMVFKLTSSTIVRVITFLFILFSNAFIDFSTSGLENPLTHFLLVCFIVLALNQHLAPSRKLFLLTLVMTLAVLNRMDTVLLFAPIVVYNWWHTRRLYTLKYIIIGCLPIFIWLLFSLFYYGFIFPNTYYAKLNTGIPALNMWRQGLFYWWDIVWHDPVTLLGLGLPFILVIWHKQWRWLPFLLGITLYGLYITSVGGDFMAGRFASAPFLMATCLTVLRLTAWQWRPLMLGIGAGVVILGCCASTIPLRSYPGFGVVPPGQKPTIFIRRPSGIANERAFYFQDFGLMNQHSGDMLSAKGTKRQPLHQEPQVQLVGVSVGFVGFQAGYHIHIIDHFALADALLARLPYYRQSYFRVGHLNRVIPNGYVQSMRQGQNVIIHPRIAQYYDLLSQVIKDELFSWKRIKAIWDINLGSGPDLIRFAYGAYPPRQRVPYDRLPHQLPLGTTWDDYRCFVITAEGLEVVFPNVVHHKIVELGADNQDSYKIQFYHDDVFIEAHTVHIPPLPHEGINQSVVELQHAARGYNRMVIQPTAGDGKYAVGYVQLP